MGSSGSHLEEIYQTMDTNFKCSVCSLYLSWSPIKISTKNGRLMCGRCKKSDYVESVHLYNIFKNLKFPCNNFSKGCTVITDFDDRNHEKKCKFFIYKRCPSQLDCNWHGTGYEILAHYKSAHAKLILNVSQFNFQIATGKVNYLYEKGKVLLLFQLTSDVFSKCLGFRVFYFNSNDETPLINYSMEFSATSNKSMILKTVNSCIPYSTSGEDLIEYNLSNIQTCLGNPSMITVKVNFEL